MPTYRVYGYVTLPCQMELEAETAKAALTQAHEKNEGKIISEDWSLSEFHASTNSLADVDAMDDDDEDADCRPECPNRAHRHQK